MKTDTLFNIYLTYIDDDTMRPVAVGCNEIQLFDVLSRHMYLAMVDQFLILPMDEYEPFKEYTL